MEKLELENHFNESHQPQYNEMTFADSHATFRMLTNAHNLNAVTVTLALLPLNQDPGRPGAGLGLACWWLILFLKGHTMLSKVVWKQGLLLNFTLVFICRCTRLLFNFSNIVV